MSVSEEEFIQGMRRYPAGVCVIATATEDGHRSGLTATAVCSLSIDPPSLIACVNRESGSLERIKKSGYFSVNMLSSAQEHISVQFASPVDGEEKFQGATWSELVTGAPTLEEAVVVFDCELDQFTDAHTHCVLVGRVKAVGGLQGDTEPLLYLGGAYGKFQSLQTESVV